MIQLKSELKTFNLKTSFLDLTFEEYKIIMGQNSTEFEQIHALTGLNEMEASVLNLESLSEFIGFLKENPFETIDESNTLLIGESVVVLPSDIGEKSWGQKIISTEALKESDPLSILAPYVQPILTGQPFDLETIKETEDQLSRIPMEDLFSGVNYIKNQLISLLERESTLLKSEVSFEQKRAGIDMFNQLGEFNSIDLIAQGKVWKYKEVLEIDYNTILNKLFKLNLTSKFEKNYSEILKEKNQ